MTLDQKIQLFLTETREQGVGSWTAAPPLVRVLWFFRLDVPPPMFWSTSLNAVVFGVAFGVVFYLIMVFALGEDWRRQLISTPIAAVIFGLGMAWFSRRLARRLRLTPWNGRPGGDV
jgi:hypothetical protein